MHFVNDAGGGANHLHVIFTSQPLKHNFQVQQPQEPAPEAKAERLAGLLFDVQGRIIQLQLDEGIAQRLKLGTIDWIDAGEDHRLDLTEPGPWLWRTALM